LNAGAYPKSSNAYDSLGEAYLDDGNRPLAIANFRRALALNQKNYSAIGHLRKLTAPQLARF
jgi:tetratricopeptide (TPR) repeat protein